AAPSEGWDQLAVLLQKSLWRGDASAVRAVLPDFLSHFRGEPLLFTSLADGGHPRDILRTLMAQTVLRALMSSVPRLGLLAEAFLLLQSATPWSSRSQRASGAWVSSMRFFRLAFRLPPKISSV